MLRFRRLLLLVLLGAMACNLPPRAVGQPDAGGDASEAGAADLGVSDSR